MINRRHIRVKVMQSVYATLQSKNENLNKEEKFLLESIENIGNLHALLLKTLVEVKELASNQMNLAKKKHLASKEDKNPNTKFINNKVIVAIEESISLNTYIEDKKLDNWKLDFKFIEILWNEIRESAIYARYIDSDSSSFEEDKEFVLAIYKKIIAPNEKLNDYIEDQEMSWSDDIPYVNTWIVKDLTSMKENKSFKLGRLYKDEEDKKFVLDLYRKNVLNHTTFDEIVNEKTPNWDSERIAGIDLILIKMALCEFMHFPSVPTRVSINEYLEISKDYSSQKSSFFINGVLDKILKEYTEEGKINKIGRGLM